MFTSNDILIECVPNFSEGRNQAVIDAIADEIRNTNEVQLLHIDTGYDANRTVYTFIGKPDAVADAACKAIKKACELIDMEQHTGKHPRMGACDVCPLIPLQNIAMEDVVELSRRLGKRIGALGIPVYLYENSAANADRKNLDFIRKGEYEAIPEKMRQENWKPDFGAAVFNKKFGMMALGARDFLIAYNINLNTEDIAAGKKIAQQIRHKRSVENDANLQYIKAIAWYIAEYGFVQISTNITNFRRSSIFYIYDLVEKLAREAGIEVKGSELIGLIPKAALLIQNPSTAPNDDEKIDYAIRHLGLNKVFPFNKNERIFL
jgi:glutamate formiminotransferase/formiminotetrahydrofolate cyclodeaminase